MSNRFGNGSPPVEMNNTIYNMVSLQPSIAVDEMRFRTIGGGPTGVGTGFGGLNIGGGIGPSTGIMPGISYPGGAYGLSNPYYNIGDSALLGLPSNLNLPTDGMTLHGGYDFSGYGDEEDDEEDREKYKDDYDYNDVRLILMKIQRYNPGIFKALMRTGMPYYEVRRIIRKIIRLTMLYMKDDD